MTDMDPSLDVMTGGELSARMDALLPPADPARPFVGREEGLKFVSFRGKAAYFDDDGTWDVPDSFWGDLPEDGERHVAGGDRML